MPGGVPSSWSVARSRSYLLRIPLFTRGAILAIALFWMATLQPAWDVREWGSLIPDKLDLTTLYRLNTYPLIHTGFFHMLVNVAGLLYLLDSFESQHGTLTSLALFFGPFSTLPALLYIFVQKAIFRTNTPVMGASVWGFLLFAIGAIQTYKTNPHFTIATYNIPTWTYPLGVLLVTQALMPSSSFVGHVCALLVGYAFGLGYLKFLAPPDKILRWVEGKLNLLGRLPHYVSMDQKTYGRFGVLPTTSTPGTNSNVPLGYTYTASSQRLGP